MKKQVRNLSNYRLIPKVQFYLLLDRECRTPRLDTGYTFELDKLCTQNS